MEESLDLKEGYKVNITLHSVVITVSTYSGYIYALETLFSMVEEEYLPLGSFADSP